MPTIGRIDFCRSKRTVRPIETADPLTTPANELASFGCKPLLAHQHTSDDAVLTAIDQKTLASSTVVASSTETDVPPTAIDASGTNASDYDPTDLFPSYTAGLGKVQPLTGTGTSPFPAPNEPVVNLNVRLGSRRIVHSIGGIPVIGDPADPGDIMAILGAGFGKYTSNTSDFNFEGDVDLNGVLRVCSKRWRAFHKYNPILRLPYTPTLSPLLVTFLSGSLYTLSFANTFSAGYTGSSTPLPTQSCSGQVSMVLVLPAFQTCAGTAFDPSPNNSGPSIIRQFCEVQCGEFTVGDYASADTVDLTLADNLRSNLIVYADATVTNVSVSPGGGSNIAITPITMSPVSSAFPNSVFDKAFTTTIDGTEDTFTFTLDGPCGTVVTNTANWFTAAGLTQIPGVHYWWEAYAHITTIPL